MNQLINIYPGHYSSVGQSGPKCDRTGRTSSGRRREIWPEEVESALLEGLRIYRPRSKNGRVPQRFPRRNCEIAEYILRETGQTRSAKQVGSRLQQIAQTCKDEEIILLITCREYVPSDGNTPNVPQPEVDNSHPRHSLSPFQRARTKENTSLPPELDYSHSAPSFPPPQSAPSTENTGISLHLQDDYRDSPASFSASQSLIEVNTSGPRLSLPHSLCYEISSEGPIDPFHVQTLHNDLSTPAIGFSFTSSFDSPPLPPDFSNLALNNSTYSACLGPSSCTPFNWEQNYEIHSGSDSSASASYFDDSGGYEFSSTRNCLCDRCTLPRLPDFWP